MNVTYKWTIASEGFLTNIVNGNPDTVVQIIVRIFATDGTNTVSFDRPLVFEPSPGQEFIPYDQLTEEQVLEWAKAKMPMYHKIEELLAKQLIEKITPPIRPVARAVPWNTCSPK